MELASHLLVGGYTVSDVADVYHLQMHLRTTGPPRLGDRGTTPHQSVLEGDGTSS